MGLRLIIRGTLLYSMNKGLRVLSAAALGLAAAYLLLRFTPYPALDAFMRREYSPCFYDRSGVLLQIPPAAGGGGVRREWAALEDIPKLAEIVVFAEDRRFFFHAGVDLAAAFRAARLNLQNRRTVSGASTITMQLARIIEGNTGGKRSALDKAAEALNALRLEARFSKKQILEYYLNALPFGYQSEGTASAARTFFGKDLKTLSEAEMFMLAVTPRRPARYSPLASPEESARAAAALARAFNEKQRPGKEAGFDASPDLEKDFLIAAENSGRFRYPFEAPHLIRYAAAQLAAAQAATRGKKKRPPVSEVRLTIDARLQELAQGLLSGNIERLAPFRITNGAALVIENRTGAVLAWAGSADFHNDAHSGQVDGVLAAMQPGSSMKPLLYALALENGFLPTDVLADVPRRYGGAELYLPQNFNNRFNGPVRFRTALASSLNIPAVELLNRLGIERYAAKLTEAGFAAVEAQADDAGLGLALGNAPVSLFELVRAFSIFPNDGRRIELRLFDDDDGDTNDDDKPARHELPRVFDADTARIIASILSDKSARALAFGQAANFTTPFPSMWKTGTANQYQSITALGATPYFTAGVWMGNFSGETVRGKTGSSTPAAVARELLIFLQGRTAEPFRTPERWERRPVCALSGMRPSAFCVSVTREWTLKATLEASPKTAAGAGAVQPAEPVCSWHQADGNVSYPAEYQAWFLQTGRNGVLDYSAGPLTLLSPRDGAVYYMEQNVPVEVSGGTSDTLTVDYDGVISIITERPFIFFLDAEPGEHRLTVRCGDEEQETRFRVSGGGGHSFQ